MARSTTLSAFGSACYKLEQFSGAPTPATWIGNAKTGNVNVGEIDDIFASQGDKLSNKGSAGDSCSFTVTFGADSLTAAGDTMNCGLNVTFDGKYRKVGPPKS